MDKAIREYQTNPSNRRAIENELVQDIVGGPPYSRTKKAKYTNILKKFNIAVIRGQNDPHVNALIDADTNDAKVQILKELQSRLSETEFTQVYNLARKQKIISDNVVKDFRRMK